MFYKYLGVDMAAEVNNRVDEGQRSLEHWIMWKEMSPPGRVKTDMNEVILKVLYGCEACAINKNVQKKVNLLQTKRNVNWVWNVKVWERCGDKKSVAERAEVEGGRVRVRQSDGKVKWRNLLSTGVWGFRRVRVMHKMEGACSVGWIRTQSNQGTP